MDSLQRGLNIRRAYLLDELGEAVEGLELGRHSVQERSSEYVHALHVREPELIVLLSVWVA